MSQEPRLVALAIAAPTSESPGSTAHPARRGGAAEVPQRRSKRTGRTAADGCRPEKGKAPSKGTFHGGKDVRMQLDILFDHIWRVLGFE